MEYNELFNRFRNITNEIALQNINNPNILKKYETLKNAFYSKNPILRISINSKLDELENLLGLNNQNAKILKK